jgi:hypothetical protein
VGHFPHRQEPARYVQALEAFLDAPGLPGARLLETAAKGQRRAG